MGRKNRICTRNNGFLLSHQAHRLRGSHTRKQDLYLAGVDWSRALVNIFKPWLLSDAVRVPSWSPGSSGRLLAGFRGSIEGLLAKLPPMRMEGGTSGKYSWEFMPCPENNPLPDRIHSDIKWNMAERLTARYAPTSLLGHIPFSIKITHSLTIKLFKTPLPMSRHTHMATPFFACLCIVQINLIPCLHKIPFHVPSHLCTRMVKHIATTCTVLWEPLRKGTLNVYDSAVLNWTRVKANSQKRTNMPLKTHAQSPLNSRTIMHMQLNTGWTWYIGPLPRPCLRSS